MEWYDWAVLRVCSPHLRVDGRLDDLLVAKRQEGWLLEKMGVRLKRPSNVGEDASAPHDDLWYLVWR